MTARVVPRSSLYGSLRSILIPQRRLRLVDLTGWAHKRLRLEGRVLVEAGHAEYPITAAWGERFHDLPDGPDGLYWRSRQYDKSFAMILVGDRVRSADLVAILDETIPLWTGDGLDEVSAAAEVASITIAR